MGMTTSFDASHPFLSVTPGPGTELASRRQLARVPIDQPPGLTGRLVGWRARRLYGQAPDNGFAMAHNRKVLLTDARFELSLARWKKLDPQLKALAVMAVSTQIECSWCLDFGYYEAHSHGLDTTKIAAVPNWRTSDVFTDTERRVIEYSQAMTATPKAISTTPCQTEPVTRK